VVVEVPPWTFSAPLEAGVLVLLLDDEGLAAALDLPVPKIRQRIATMIRDDAAFRPRGSEGGPYRLAATEAAEVLTLIGGAAAVRALRTLRTAFDAGQQVLDGWMDSARPARAAAAPMPKPGSEDEKKRILESLDRNRWNVQAVGRELGYARRTLYRRMREFGIER
jgi:hypothetical protein